MTSLRSPFLLLCILLVAGNLQCLPIQRLPRQTGQFLQDKKDSSDEGKVSNTKDTTNSGKETTTKKGIAYS